MAEQHRRQPVRKSKKQIRRQRQLTVAGVVAGIFLIIFGLGALWGRSLGGVKAEDIAKTLQGMGQAVQVSYDYSNVLRLQNRDTFYGWSEAENQKNFTIMYQGAMQIGSDTSKLTKDDIVIDKKTVTVKVPAVKIIVNEINQSSISVYDTEDKKFREIRLEDFTGFCNDQMPIDEQAAFDSGKVSSAQERLTNVITLTLKEMAKFESVKVEFQNG
ncbi:MAG: DUF4230 domain-containing protein [Butyricicoccus sp.]|nr:DUF4230 domain-containing protein [Butyricicoccus pullicaecorum]